VINLLKVEFISVIQTIPAIFFSFLCLL